MPKQEDPNADFEATVKEIESIEFSLNPSEREEWPTFLDELRGKADRLKYLEEAHDLFTTDRVPRYPEGVRRYLLEALDALIIPKKLTDEEQRQFAIMLGDYASALQQWKEELLDRLYNRAGREREVVDHSL